MTMLGNDRWLATFAVDELRPYEYTVEGWVDRFETWRHELSKKVGAGQDVGSELLEGSALLRETVERMGAGSPGDAALLGETAEALARRRQSTRARVSNARSS